MSSRYTFFLIALAFFAANAAITLSEIYGDALFLSSYPSSWLSYLFLGIVILNSLVFSFLLPIVKQQNVYVNRAIVAILIALGCLWAVLLPLNLFWVPFAYALYRSMFFPILTILCFNLASNALSIREFKHYSTKFRASGSLAIILSANATVLLIFYFSIEALFYLSLAFLIPIEVVLFILTPSPQTSKREVLQKEAIWRYPLVRVALPMVVFMAVGFFTAEYLLKYRLSQEMAQTEIAIFMGYFVSIVNILSLVMQLFFSEKIINRFGLAFVFYITPTVILIGATFTFLLSNLFVLAFMAMCVSVGYWSLHLIAFEMLLMPLPAKVRISAKALEGGILEFIGQGITALFFICLTAFNLSENAKMLSVLFLSLGYCIPWFYLIPKVQLFYQQTLEDAIRIRGFTFDSQMIGHTKELNIQDMALSLLENPKPAAHPVAYFLLKQQPHLMPAAWEILKQKISQADELEKIQALDCLANKDFQLYLPYLIELLSKETNVNIIWELVRLLAPTRSILMRTLVESVFQQQLSAKQVYLVPLAFCCGEFDIIEKGLQVLKKAYEREDNTLYIALARVLGIIPIGKFKDVLASMLKKQHEDVVLEAIKTVKQRHMTELVPEIMTNLGRPNISHAASSAIQSFGEMAIPGLELLALDERRLERSMAAIKTLVFIPNHKAEEAILTVANSRNALITTHLAECSINANCKLERSPNYKQNIYNLILREASLRENYKMALHLKLPKYLLNEFQVKLHMASLRCLYWYGSYIHPEKVVQFISLLSDIDFDYNRTGEDRSDSVFHERLHTVLELLGSLTNDKQLVEIFTTWEIPPKVKYEANALDKFLGLDVYIDLLIDYSRRQEDNIMESDIQKLIILRSVKLFEKLPSEVLFVMAQEASLRDMSYGEVLFEEGAASNELYIVAAGEVNIVSKGKITATLKEHDFFGEIGIINNSPRLATAIAAADGMLLTLDRITMNDIVNEFPDVLRAITRVVIGYLQKR